MDLAIFFKDYQVIITVVSGFLLAILGYIFGRWNTVENRQFSRRAAIHDMRIQEARDYINTWSTLINLLIDFERLLREGSSMETVNQNMLFLAQQYENVDLTLRDMSNKGSSIDVLNDAELTNLRSELKTLKPTLLDTIKILDKLIANYADNADNSNSINIKEFNLEGYKEAFRNGDKIIIKMKIRLDKLAQKVP